MNVLVVDDDPDYRFLVEAALGRVASVVCASSAAEAVDVADAFRPDVVLVDASLPGVFGAVHQLRGVVPGVRIVLTSIRSASELASAAAASGAVGYLRKDLAPSTLPDVLAELTMLVGSIKHCVARIAQRLPADNASPAAARRLVGEKLGDWYDGDAVDAVLLCVSELVTNAVVHARSMPVVSVEVRPATVRVEVRDTSPEPPKAEAGPVEGTSGRGLAIVEAVADRWGTRHHSDGGKTVWFEVGRSAAGHGTDHHEGLGPGGNGRG